MTSQTLLQFPGHSPGYLGIPETLRRQIAQDIPVWSEFIRQEAERFSYPYIDTAENFFQRLEEAESLLTGRS